MNDVQMIEYVMTEQDYKKLLDYIKLFDEVVRCVIDNLKEKNIEFTPTWNRITKVRYNRSIQEGLRKAVQVEKFAYGEDI